MADYDALRVAAAQAADQAYPPYSGLRVGAALRATSGRVYCGCNVENGALPVGGCAGRAAIAATVLAEGPGFRLVAIAVVAIECDGDGEDTALAVPPRGACRQALVEFGADAEVGFLDANGRWTVMAADALLPHRFALPQC